MSKNRMAAMAAQQAAQAPTEETQVTEQALEQQGAADGGEGTETTETEQADTAVAEQAPVVTETATLAEAAVGNMASRGTIAPPRVKMAQSSVQRVAPVVPNTNPVKVGADDKPELIDEVLRIIEGVPPTHHFQILSIVEYCKKADLKQSNDVKTLANLNVGLWRNISALINKQEVHFDALFTALLRVFALESKNAMSEIAINRGIEHMALPKQELAGYMNITTLLRLTSDPKSRKQVLKTAVNLPMALRNGLTQEGAARVVAYYETH